MRSFKQIARQSIGKPILADDIVEFHGARLLMLIAAASSQRIDGLTKLAKLDFFVRYPAFFDQTTRARNAGVQSPKRDAESNMIRFRYGPWDPRYYQVIPFLEARGLIEVEEDGRSICFTATDAGTNLAQTLRSQPSYATLAAQIDTVLKTFGRKNGNQLKELIYRTFESEVADRKMGEEIE